jgi:hypothetical protein
MHKKESSIAGPQHDGMLRLFLSVFAATILLVSLAGLAAARPHGAGATRDGQGGIITWGQVSPAWQNKLHVTAVRVGCSDRPQSCMKYGTSLSQGKPFFLAMLLKQDTQGYGTQYSELSLQNPLVVGVGLDDFGSQYYKLYRAGISDPPAFLDGFISGLKSRNPRLKFGATIYEDDLGTKYFDDQHLPPELRNKFDVVHFFIHYRGDTPKYEQYIQQIKRLFPNAQIAAGVYAYDRISYVPCVPKGQPCSQAEEMNYFRQSLNDAISLLHNGTASWIELFPSLFGKEARWSDWSYPRLCPAGRKPECVANTKVMDQAVVTQLQHLSD